MIYIINVNEFHEKNLKNSIAILKTILQTAENSHMKLIKEMTIVNLNKHAFII